MARAKSTALSRSDRSFTKLQVAVAAASARPADEQGPGLHQPFQTKGMAYCSGEYKCLRE